MLLAGGADKGSDFTEMAKEIKERVKFVVLFAGAGSDRLKEELDLDYVYSNELKFSDGKLDGVNIIVDSNKAKSARIKIEEWNMKKEDIVVVVDGANDIKLFDICGLGIAYRAQDIVKDLATVTLEEKNLAKIIDIINQHYHLKLESPTIA